MVCGCNMKKGMSEACYKFFSTLANPTRLAVLERLMDGSMNVTDLARELNQEQSMVSKNLKPLSDCRFVNVEQYGREGRYSVNNETVETILKTLESHSENYCPSKG